MFFGVLCARGDLSSSLLHIYLDKSCFMYFPPKRRFHKISNTDKKCSSASNKNTNTTIEKTNATIYLGENIIKEVTEVRFLGIIFDPLLEWSAHIQYLKKQVLEPYSSIFPAVFGKTKSRCSTKVTTINK